MVIRAAKTLRIGLIAVWASRRFHTTRTKEAGSRSCGVHSAKEHSHSRWHTVYSTDAAENDSESYKQADGSVWRCTGGRHLNSGQDGGKHRNVVAELVFPPSGPL
eukprot:3413776-Pyramimonas_sp.AAC.1